MNVRVNPWHGLILVFALAACGQQAGSVIPGRAAPSQDAAHRASTTKTTIAIRVPRQGLRPHYVAPTTQSAAIEIGPAAGCAACTPASSLYVGLTQTSPNCVTDTSGTTCTFALALHPGVYIGTISTYDGPLDAQHLPTGKLLSLSQTFPMSVIAGKSNAPKITLDGVPANLTTFNLGGTLVITGTRFEMVGASSHALFQVYAMDPDGNVIVGAGAPAFGVTTDGGFTNTVKGNTVELVAPPHAVKGTSAITIKAVSPACAAAGANCTLSGQLSFDPLIAVANTGNDSVKLLAAGTGLAYATITDGIKDPVDLKFDATGNLFVANKTANTVTEYAPPYTGAPMRTISNGVSSPTALAFSPNGSFLAVADSGTSRTTLYAPPFTGNPGEVDIATNALAFDFAGNLWLATPASSVLRFKPPFASADVVVTNGVVQPASIGFDIFGNLFVANPGPGTVTKYAAPSFSGAPASVGSLTSVQALTMLPLDGLFVACSAGQATVLSTSFAPVAAFNTNVTPCRTAFDQDFTLWISYANSNVVQSYVYPFVNVTQYTGMSHPGALAAFPGS
jgi:hypothetical protein